MFNFSSRKLAMSKDERRHQNGGNIDSTTAENRRPSGRQHLLRSPSPRKVQPIQSQSDVQYEIEILKQRLAKVERQNERLRLQNYDQQIEDLIAEGTNLDIEIRGLAKETSKLRMDMMKERQRRTKLDRNLREIIDETIPQLTGKTYKQVVAEQYSRSSDSDRSARPPSSDVTIENDLMAFNGLHVI